MIKPGTRQVTGNQCREKNMTMFELKAKYMEIGTLLREGRREAKKAKWKGKGKIKETEWQGKAKFPFVAPW